MNRSAFPGPRVRLRQAANLVNLATPLGLLVALLVRARLSRGPHGLILARDPRAPVRGLPAPAASAITVGDVVFVLISDERLAARPRLLHHEARHAVQYACLLGPVPFFTCYGAAAAWSWLTTRNPALRNPFERGAGLLDGGYAHLPDGLPDLNWARRSRWAARDRYRRRRLGRGRRGWAAVRRSRPPGRR